MKIGCYPTISYFVNLVKTLKLSTPSLLHEELKVSW